MSVSIQIYTGSVGKDDYHFFSFRRIDFVQFDVFHLRQTVGHVAHAEHDDKNSHPFGPS